MSPQKKTLLHVLAISQCTSCHRVYLRGGRHKQLGRIQQSRGKYGKYEEKLFFLLLTHTKTNNVSLKHLLNHHLRWFHFLQKRSFQICKWYKNILSLLDGFLSILNCLCNPTKIIERIRFLHSYLISKEKDS